MKKIILEHLWKKISLFFEGLFFSCSKLNSVLFVISPKYFNSLSLDVEKMFILPVHSGFVDDANRER